MGADTSIKKELIYPNESYEIIGLAMKIHSELGNNYQEKHYQKVFEGRLKNLNISFEKEKRIIAKTNDGLEIGEFFVDFVVFDKILLEFKRVNFIHYNDVKQTLRYLDATGLKLGIIINFKLNKLQYRRVINPRV